MLRLSRRELLVLTILFAASLPAVTPRLYSSDEVQYFAYLRSLWFDHDVSFENEYRYFYDHAIAQSDGYYDTFLVRETAVGRRKNYGTMGAAILWAPFYAIADAATKGDGYSQPYIDAVAYGSALWGFAAILLSIRAARLIVGQESALAAAGAVWLGTPLLFYMYVAPPFAHATSAFAVALFVTIWLHVRRTWSVRGTAALGAAAALMAMVREQDAFFVVGPALDFALALWDRQRDSAHARRLPMALAAAAGGAVCLIVFAPQLLAYKALNGFFGPASDVQRKMTWYSPHALQALLSPEHGFLFWTPLAALAIGGLVLLALGPDATRRRIAVCLLLMIAAQAYISGAVESWTVAGAFGQRRFVCLTALLVVGLTATLSVPGRTLRLAAATATAVTVWWNLALTAAFGIGLMDRQRLELRRNVYDAFVTMPAMVPELTYRYFAHRTSFFKPPAPPAPR